jgi:cytochrome c biogenesis protein CcmG/thiol:disulfide interchange protein DsbE
VKGEGALGRPDGIGAGPWRVGLALWGLVLLSLGLLAALGPARPTLAEAWQRFRGAPAAPDGPRSAANLGQAPDFTLSLFDGATFRLADHRGQVVVVNFWASWCVPCRDEAPRLAAASRAYGDRGVVFVGVDTQDVERDARSFLAEFGVGYANGLDRGMATTSAYGVTSLPATVIVDREGQIRRRWLGEIREGQLAAFIEDALR